MRGLAVLLALAAPALTPGRAAADDDSFPALVGTVDTGLYTTRTIGSQAFIRKVDTVALLGHLRAGLFLSPELSIQSQVTYEPLRTPLRMPHKKHVFADEGLYMEQLYAKVELDDLMVYAGKLDLPLSLAADIGPGLFGADYATDYQLREMMGFGGAVHISPANWGHHRLGFARFFADNSWLDAAAFTQPNFGSIDTARTGRLHLGNGGAANTGSPQSPMVTLDGDASPLGMPALTYHLAWASLRHGVDDTRDQTDLVGALHYEGDLGAGFVLRPLIEVARIQHAGGSPVSGGALLPAAQRADYLSSGVELGWNNWSVSVVRAQRMLIEPVNGSGLDGRSSFERLLTGTVGYAFDWGLSVAAGWKHDHSLAPGTTLNADTDSVGLLVNYHQDF